MAEGLLAASSQSNSGNGLSWELIESISNTTYALNLGMPSGTEEYIFIYAVCSLNSQYTYTDTREQAYVGLLKGAGYYSLAFDSSVIGELATIAPGSYVTPVFSRFKSNSSTYFILDTDLTYSVGTQYFFGLVKFIISWGYCTGKVGQISATFYGIKAPS